jgi:hypothetical protein
MRKIQRKFLIFGLGFMIIVISGVFIIFSYFEISEQQIIMNEQQNIMDENRQWAEKITFWEVTGGLGDDIIEGEKIYYDALAKYSAAVQAQNLAIFFIIVLCIIIITTVGSLIIKIC